MDALHTARFACCVLQAKFEKYQAREAESTAKAKIKKPEPEPEQGSIAGPPPCTAVSVGLLRTWRDAPCGFTDAAATHTELCLLGEDGVLYAWCWGESAGRVHPRALELCPATAGEAAPMAPIAVVHASPLRASVLTADGRVATWMDPLLHAAAGGGGGGGGGGGDERAPSVLPHLEHAASAFEGPSTRTYRVLFFAACTFWS